MLALHDAEAAAGAKTAKSTDAHMEEALAKKCKRLSFDLYTSIDRLASVAEQDTVSVDLNELRAWLATLRELNCCISEYACASIARVDRLQIEMALAQNAMASDLLDREACHTHTLETITKLQLEEEAPPPTTRGRTPSTRVVRAMQAVVRMHASTAPFTANAPLGYFGAAECRDEALRP